MKKIGLFFADYGMGPGKVIANLQAGLRLIGQPYVSNQQRAINGCLNWQIEILKLPPNTLIGPNLKGPSECPQVFATYKNAVLSAQWLVNQYKKNPICADVDFKVWPVGIDTTRFTRTSIPNIKRDCFIYRKNRTNDDLNRVKQMLMELGFTYTTLDYDHYTEAQLINVCNESLFCVMLDATEGQGIATMEILSMGTPIFVLETDSPLRQYGASSVPYFSNECGSIAEGLNCSAELEAFVHNLNSFSPRAYIESNHTLEISARKYMELIEGSHK